MSVSTTQFRPWGPASTRPSAQVKLWAPLGVLCLVVIAQGWIRWLLSDDASPVPIGPDRLAGWRYGLMRTVEFGVLAVALVLVWTVVLRPLLRERQLSFDGRLMIGMWLLWFWDPVVNYFNFSFAYNHQLVNLGNWVRFIPGWEAPNQQYMPEPLLFVGGSYVVLTFGGSLLGCAVLRLLHGRYPRLGRLGLYSALGAFIVVVDFFLEAMLFIRTGIFAYPGAPHSLTLWAGDQYQFPLYQPIGLAVFVLIMSAVRWERDDHGRSFAERGVDELQIPRRACSIVSFLALCGFMHVTFLVTYYVPYNWFALKADTFPALPSYMRAGICGKGTDYACPSEFVPIPSQTSLHIRPDDPDLPEPVRARQGSGR